MALPTEKSEAAADLQGKARVAINLDASKRRLIRNALHNSGAWIATAVVTMLATPYMVFALGPEGYGVYVLLTSLIGYYGLFDLALGQGVVKFVAQYSAQGDSRGVTQSINAALTAQVVAGFIGSCLLIVASPFVLWFLRVPESMLESARISLILCAVGFFFTMIGGTLNSVLMGMQRYDLSSKVNALANLSTVVATVAVLAAGKGLEGAVIISVASAIATCGVSYAIVHRILPSWAFAVVFRGMYVKSVYRFSSYLVISRIGDLVNSYAGRLLIGYLLGPVAVTIYSVPAKAINAVWAVVGSAFGVLFPYASEIDGAKDAQLNREVFVKASRLFGVCMLPIFAILFTFSSPILRIWMGEGFAAEAWPVLSILCAATALASVTTIPIQFVLGWGQSKTVGMFYLGTIFTYVTALMVLCPIWGVTGAAWAMVFGGLPGLLMVVVLLRQVVHIGLRDYLRDVYLYHVIGVVLSAAFWIGHDVVFELPLAAVTVLATSFGGIYLVVLRKVGWLPGTGMVMEAIRTRSHQ